jgi:hypothetical protein
LCGAEGGGDCGSNGGVGGDGSLVDAADIFFLNKKYTRAEEAEGRKGGIEGEKYKHHIRRCWRSILRPTKRTTPSPQLEFSPTTEQLPRLNSVPHHSKAYICLYERDKGTDSDY